MNRTSDDLRGLITDLDAKLGGQKAVAAPTPPPSTSKRRIPAWAMFAAVTLLGLGLGTVIVRPWQERCSYSTDLCRVQELDIDALRVTIPNSQLITALPNIDALDPDDVLTTGDIFAMERFADLDLETLITDEEVELVLRYID